MFLSPSRTLGSAVATAGIICTLAGTAAAQQIRGTVRDSAAAAPLSGAVATIVDSAGRDGARTIADANGRFALPLRGAARVHVIRIGYRPQDVPIPAHTAGLDVSIVVDMTRIPPVLETMRVSDKELCPGSSDRGAAFQLWDQARAGLLAEVVAREANPAEATTIAYQRLETASDERVVHQSVTSKTGHTTRPFVAAEAPSMFAEHGYMQEDASGRVFDAPDADVLLDESFAATHCFHLEHADTAHEDQVGLAFTPVPARDRSIVDVTGVIWIDAKTPALRSLDFLFTQLEPAAIRARVGGHLQFRTVENGIAFVEWWWMRMPVLQQNVGTRLSWRSGPGTPRQDRKDFSVSAIQQAGGEVVQAEWRDGTAWHTAQNPLAGVVTQRSTNQRPVANAVVAIDGTEDSTTTNSRGEFLFPSVIPGKYTVVVRDTNLKSYVSERRASEPVEVRRGEVSRLSFELPSAADVIAEGCGGVRRDQRTGTIVGRVLLSNGTLPSNVELRASWQADYNHGAPITTSDGVAIATSDQRIAPDPFGRFIVCGVAVGRPIRIHLSLQTSAADTTVFATDTSITSLEWRARLRTP